MKKFPLDLSKFRKISSDNVKSTLEHADGHQFIVAHSKLSPDLRSALEQIPTKMADGGEVDPDSSQVESAEPDSPEKIAEDAAALPAVAQAPVDSSTAMGNAYAQAYPSEPGKPVEVPGDATGAAYATAYNKSLEPPAPAQAAPAAAGPVKLANYDLGSQPSAQGQVPQDPYGAQAYSNAYMSGLGEQKAGLAGEAAATGQQGREEAAVAQQQAQAAQALHEGTEKHLADLNNERAAILKDYQAGHIDPNQYIHSKGTGQRVTTAIGLILGGFGGGLTGQENPALKFLNSQIERNVDAQKMEMDKKVNLLKVNQQQFGNLKDATEMTRVMNLDYYSAQLKQAAAKAMDPIAKARGLQAAGQLDAQAAPIVSQIAMRKALLSGPTADRIDPAMKVRLLVDDKEKPDAYKELQTAQNMSRQRDNLMGAFDQLNQVDTVGNRAINPIQAPKQVAAIREPLLAQLVKDSEGRITPQDTQMLRGLFPSSGDNANTIQLKRSQMAKFINEKMNFPILSAYGIRMGGAQATPLRSVPQNYKKPGSSIVQVSAQGGR